MSGYCEEIQVDKSLIKFIVGKGGSNINKLRETHDVQIEFEKREGDDEKEKEPEKEEKSKDKPKGKEEKGKDKNAKAAQVAKKEDPNTRKVTIKGFKKNVETVRDLLLSQVKEFTEGGGLVIVDLKIDQKYHGNLIGNQGKVNAIFSF